MLASKFLCPAQTAPSRDSLDIMIGQMILVGIGDIKTADDYSTIYREINKGKVGGIIIYQKNIGARNSTSKLKGLIERMQSYAPTPLFVSIDEEGGFVNRLKPKYGFFNTVSAQYLGKVNNKDTSRYYADRMSSQMKNLGINMNFAPVLDLNINPNNPIIGKIERSFSKNPKVASIHAKVFIESHLKHNIVPVVKHFPGHGSSKSDTHLGLTDVSNTWDVSEIFPYSTLLKSNSLDAIMTAHIINRRIDNSNTPCTLSKRAINDLLRGMLGYKGVVFSDDMQMGAIKNEFGTKTAIKLAINAGVDVLMFANNVHGYEVMTVTEMHKIIKNLVLNGEIKRSRIKESFNRIIELKRKIGILAEPFNLKINPDH